MPRFVDLPEIPNMPDEIITPALIAQAAEGIRRSSGDLATELRVYKVLFREALRERGQLREWGERIMESLDEWRLESHSPAIRRGMDLPR